VKTVSLKQVGYEELALSPHVQEALGELVGSANAGLLALSVGLGLAVLAELLEEEVVEVVGPKGKKHIPERTAVRHGHEAGEVTLGGRRVAVERPRVRTADGRAEVRLRTCEYFTDRDPLSRAVPERMLAGVSTRRYRRTPAPVGQDVEQRARSTSESSVSHPTQCEALVVRRDGAALDRRRHARSRTAVSEDHRLRDLATLVIAIERDHDRRRHARAAPGPTEETAIRPAGASPNRERCRAAWASW
jgi:hypothetical protein